MGSSCQPDLSRIREEKLLNQVSRLNIDLHSAWRSEGSQVYSCIADHANVPALCTTCELSLPIFLECVVLSGIALQFYSDIGLIAGSKALFSAMTFELQRSTQLLLVILNQLNIDCTSMRSEPDGRPFN